MAARVHLTKSRCMKGRTCKKRLWLSVHEPAPDAENLAGAITAGRRVGLLARQLFPGGRLVEALPWEHGEAMAETAELMVDESVPAIFEAAFESNGVRVRCDILERRSRGKWTLHEVKSGKTVKDDHFYDVALQVYVLRGAGVELEGSGVQHINGDYCLEESGLNVSELFTFTDVVNNTEMLLKDVENDISIFHSVLLKQKAPDIDAGMHCSKDCEFLERCTADKPSDWVRKLPRISAKKFIGLLDLGVESVADIPADFNLTEEQGMFRKIYVSGRDFVSPDMPKLLHGMGPPTFYLDFETVSPAVPLYLGTKPYQTIPFQCSIHYWSGAEKLDHWEFLADGRMDPRREITEFFLDILAGKKTPVLAYSSYERTTLGYLRAAVPDLASGIDDILDRLCDLKISVNQTWLRGYDFSRSLKNAAPALSPGFGYGDLEDVAEGTAAADVFERIVRGELTEGESESQLRESLLAYCKRDTEAMVEIHKALLKYT